uniref:Uncharacterized protein n=1 Tax=Siphoviridae sp. ctJYR23 TaxID=2827837 RepID=A0A8S5SLG1_9CAUD|nr:MAG TPA: hypothetical protein [Siphoviridae sp. ctJYR23]
MSNVFQNFLTANLSPQKKYSKNNLQKTCRLFFFCVPLHRQHKNWSKNPAIIIFFTI